MEKNKKSLFKLRLTPLLKTVLLGESLEIMEMKWFYFVSMQITVATVPKHVSQQDLAITQLHAN